MREGIKARTSSGIGCSLRLTRCASTELLDTLLFGEAAPLSKPTAS